MKSYRIFSVLLLVFSIPGQLLAQHRDTLYVVEEEPVYDTLFVHDTLRTYDTVSLDEYIHSREFEQLFYSSGYVDSQQHPDSAKKLYRQTVTYWENHVLHNEQEKIANMDSIKKYGLAALIVLGLNGLAPGQTTDIQNEEPQSKIGYYHALGVDYVICPAPMVEQDDYKYFGMGARLHVLNGIEFNPWLTLSLDFQLAYTHGYEDLPTNSFDILGFKLGLDFRYRLLNSFKWSPVLGIAGGPSMELTSYLPQEGVNNGYWGWNGYISQYSKSYWSWGGYISTSVGCSYRYKNNKQLWFGVSYTFDIGSAYLALPLAGFRFEIQL